MNTKKTSIEMLLRTFVLSSQVPETVVYSDHMPRFEGYDASLTNPDLVWGVQGTNSINSANAYASMDARYHKRKVFLVDLFYQIENMPSASSVISEDSAMSSGYFHFDRLEMNFRSKLFAQFLDYLPAEKRAEFEGLTLQDLLCSNPMLVHRYMKETPECRACLHNVCISGGVKLRLGTVRKDPDAVRRVLIRYHEGIKVTL